MSDYSGFYKLMYEVDRRKRQEVETECAKLWASLLGLLTKISSSEIDGSGFYEVREHADKIADELRLMLESKQ